MVRSGIIRKKGKTFDLVKSNGVENFKTRRAAVKRERQINYFKNKKGGSISSFVRPLLSRISKSVGPVLKRFTGPAIKSLAPTLASLKTLGPSIANSFKGKAPNVVGDFLRANPLSAQKQKMNKADWKLAPAPLTKAVKSESYKANSNDSNPIVTNQQQYNHNIFETMRNIQDNNQKAPSRQVNQIVDSLVDHFRDVNNLKGMGAIKRKHSLIGAGTKRRNKRKLILPPSFSINKTYF